MTLARPAAALLATILALVPLTLRAAGGVHDFTLPNGLEIVVIEDHRAPVAVNMVWYRVGSADETPGRTGLAHFFEHLMFKGTDELAPGEFSRLIEAEGGEDNAFTSRDYTAYYERLAADRLELALRLEADRMRDLRLTEELVATELQVILEERALRVDSDPGALLGEQRMAVQFLNHPYGRPVIGWKHEVEKLTLADALAFYRRWYAPNNAILVVGGDVDPDEVRRLAARLFGPLRPTPGLEATRRRPQEPAQLAPRRLTLHDERVAQPAMIRSWLSPQRRPGDQRRAAAVAVLAELLGGSGITSVLGRELVLERPVAVAASAWADTLAVDPATFGISLVPAAGVSAAEAEAALDTVLARFLEAGPDPADLERVRARIRAAEIYARDDIFGRARRYGAGRAVGLTLEDIESWPEVLGSVTLEDVRAAARDLLRPETSVTAWLLPPDRPGPDETPPSGRGRQAVMEEQE